VFARWLYKSWKYFWGIVLSLLLTVVIISATVIGVLQLDMTRNYLADRIEKQVETSYKADLTIGEINGFLPFRMGLQDVTLTHADSTVSQPDTLASIRQINTQIDVWGLLQNRISIIGFSVDQPRIWLRSGEEGRLQFLESRATAKKPTQTKADEPWLSTVEILAPDVSVSGGTVYLSSSTRKTQIGNLPQSFSLHNINTELFVDWSSQQRYLDIESFAAETQNLNVGNIEISGQFFSDSQLLEFNSFYVTLGNSRFVINGEINGVNLLEPDLTGQLLASRFNLDVTSDEVYLRNLRDLFGSLPDNQTPINLELRTEGTTDSLMVDRAWIVMGQSAVNLNGMLKNLGNPQDLGYQVQLNRINIKKDAFAQLIDSTTAIQYSALDDVVVSGTANGSMDSLNVDISAAGSLGQLSLQGQTQLAPPYEYWGTASGKSVNVGRLTSTVDSTALNFDARLEGVGFTLEGAVTEFAATITNSRIGDVDIPNLELNSSLVNGSWSQEYAYRDGEQRISGSGIIDFGREEPPISMRGNAQNIDLAKFFGDLGFASSELNFDYNVELQGLSPARLQGRANLDITPSVIGGDSVRAHQFYMDLNAPDASERSFRLTSSLFDMNLTGQIDPGNIVSQVRFWTTHLRSRLKSEILMTAPVDTQIAGLSAPASSVVLDGNMQAKDLGLIKKYMPGFPTINTDSQINFNLNTDGTRLLFSAKMQADTLIYNNLNFSNSSTQLTASFRSDRSFSEFSSIDFEADVGALETESVDLDSMGIDLALKKDSVRYTQHVGTISENARHRMTLNSSIADSAISISVQDFFLGNDNYAWINDGTSSLTYQRGGNINFEQFGFQNNNEYFRLQGTLSENRSDSLRYTLRDINLSRISNLIKGQINFTGILNGTFITRSLTRQPTVQGNLNVNRLALNDRLIGDVRFNSQYNPAENRFDTQVDIVTDSTKYQDYLATNDGIGQDIQLDGYFLTPNPQVEQDSVFYFDTNFEQIDMWIIGLLVDNVFAEMEGQATGQGYISGNFSDFDFHADFQTKNVFAKPQFLNTNYFLNGHVILDREQGVVLDSLDVLDTTGGTGIVSGTIDFNDFKPITFLDLTMDMNGLQFLNTKLDRDVPFYGNVSGTGTIKLTGSNRDLYMRTVNPVSLTSDSEVSIPLLEETELEQTGQFIQFVESFENVEQKTASLNEQTSPESVSDQEQLETAIESMTFTERFDLDLQFQTSNNITVNLVFDPVTGEILTARGTGQLRITMQDQDVQMFGRYNINGGDYQFVTGEIISRRLQLEPGGTIIWEGPPNNARLDISAVYNARPNVATLISEEAIQDQSQNGGQQVPIDLILEINGTLNSVENNYYFELPSSLDLSSSSTLQYTINQINRDEQQKLLQATSIFLTGQFIPTEGTSSRTASLSQSLTRGSTVLNPILSNQVISPLLSNQINALLNSDVSRLDIDFNLNAYNEVDLGIALRLYNDRLILRREGQITGGGPQSTLGDRIGDLNATYRIRRGLSLTAFHRQDQVLNSLGATSSQAGDVTPSVDGIGLEARMQYNTWKEFLSKINRSFKWLFGGSDNDDEQQSEDELVNQEANDKK
jgi:hypothetical protein